MHGEWSEVLSCVAWVRDLPLIDIPTSTDQLGPIRPTHGAHQPQNAAQLTIQGVSSEDRRCSSVIRRSVEGT